MMSHNINHLLRKQLCVWSNHAQSGRREEECLDVTSVKMPYLCVLRSKSAHHAAETFHNCFPLCRGIRLRKLLDSRVGEFSQGKVRIDFGPFGCEFRSQCSEALLL